jgi:hypothetical protein
MCKIEERPRLWSNMDGQARVRKTGYFAKSPL